MPGGGYIPLCWGILAPCQGIFTDDSTFIYCKNYENLLLI